MSTPAKSKSMTEGPLAKQILLVSLPLALSNLLQILFNLSDVAVVGRFAGSTALGAVGSTATFVTLFTGFLIGLSNGINVLVARFYGARHPKDVSKTVHSALLVSLAAGVLLLGYTVYILSPALGELRELAGEEWQRWLTPVLRSLGIAVVAGCGADVCRDLGQDSVASGIELAGKAEIMLVCLPLITELLSLAIHKLQLYPRGRVLLPSRAFLRQSIQVLR